MQYYGLLKIANSLDGNKFFFSPFNIEAIVDAAARK